MDFETFFDNLKSGIIALAEEELGDFKEEAVKNGHLFLDRTRHDLAEWANQVADGSLSSDEFQFLLEGKKNLSEMEVLKQKGLAQVRLDKFQNSIFKMVTTTTFKTFFCGVG